MEKRPDGAEAGGQANESDCIGSATAAVADADDALPQVARMSSASSTNHAHIEVVVGTSALATSDFVSACARMINMSYGYHRVSEGEICNRLAMGDSSDSANRVLHVATRGGALVGCCSSTKQTPWCPSGCGHWGLLVVDVAAQGTGVATALVTAAEQRLREAGLRQVQIEYEYTPGDPHSERLYGWYEGKCGFSGGGPSSTYYSSFRRCRKSLTSCSPNENVTRQTRGSPNAVHPATTGKQASSTDSSPADCLSWLRKAVRALARRAMVFPPLEAHQEQRSS